MMRVKTILAIWVCTTASALGAGLRVDVAAGEHGTYSRIVVPQGADGVEIDKSARSVRLRNIDPSMVYGLQNINDRHKAHRIVAAKRIRTNTGDAIELTLTCDCEIRTSRLANGKFILDVFDSDAANTAHLSAGQDAAADKDAPVTPAQQLSVEQAHKQMIELLKQAAREGLVTIKPEDGGALTPAQASLAESAPADDKNAAPTDLIAQTLAQAAHNDAPKPTLTPKTPEKCLPDAVFSIDGADFDDEPLVRIAELQSELAETAAPENKKALHALANGYLSIGFGEEALALLTDYNEADSPLADMARAVAERPVRHDSPLLSTKQCVGAQALWQAAVADPKDVAQLYNRSSGALSSLPPRLKALIGARLAVKMIAAEAWPQAEELYQALAAEDGASSPELDYVKAMLEQHQGDDETSKEELKEIAGGNTDAAEDAMLALADRYLKNQETPYEGFTEDIGAVAKVKGSTQAALAEAIAWANVGNIDAAMLLFENVVKKSPEDSELARKLTHAVFDKASSSDKPLLQLAALDAFIEHKDWFVLTADDVETRRKVARAALKLSLPDIAADMLEGAADNGDIALIRERAAAALAAGRADDAIRIAAPYSDDEALREIIVKANLNDGKYNDALAAAATLKDPDAKNALVARAAWLARSWISVVKSLRDVDPTQLTENNALKLGLAAYSAGEKTLPAAADAVLNDKDATLAAGLRSMFAPAPKGSALQRSRSEVDATRDGIRMIEEIMSNG